MAALIGNIVRNFFDDRLNIILVMDARDVADGDGNWDVLDAVPLHRTEDLMNRVDVIVNSPDHWKRTDFLYEIRMRGSS